jgi:hypothetical protein
MVVDHVLDYSQGEIEEYEFEPILLREGATYISKPENPNHDDPDVKVDQVQWVTQLTPFNKVRTEHMLTETRRT